jgi:hypothetical protein
MDGCVQRTAFVSFRVAGVILGRPAVRSAPPRWRRDRRCVLVLRPCSALGESCSSCRRRCPGGAYRRRLPASHRAAEARPANDRWTHEPGERDSDRSKTHRDAAAERSRLPADSPMDRVSHSHFPASLSGAGAAFTRRAIAGGSGWCVSDIGYAAGEEGRPLRDRHGAMSITAIAAGSFCYRSTHGNALLAPGALLLGNAGSAYECSFERSPGDRGLHFAYAPDLLEEVAAAVPSVRHTEFPVHRIPPVSAILSCAGRRGTRPAGWCGGGPVRPTAGATSGASWRSCMRSRWAMPGRSRSPRLQAWRA